MSRRKPQNNLPDQDQQAEEVHEGVEQSFNPIQESQSQGQDLQQNAQKDYEAIAELDQYEQEGIDDQELEEDLPAARKKAQKQLAQRQRRQMFGGDLSEYIDDDFDEQKLQMDRRKAIYYDDQNEDIDQRRYLDVEEVKGKLTLWIRQDETINQNQTNIYWMKLRQMCITNQQSLQISYNHLKQALPTIAMWVGLQPYIILPQLCSITYSIASRSYPTYKDLFAQVFIKIKDLPILDYIRDLRHIHLGKLIKVQGVVTIRSQVFSQMKKILYKCVRCGAHKGPFFINNIQDIRLGSCVSCQSTGPFLIDKQKTIYRNYQKLTLQESPSEVLPGRIPRSKEIVLFGDNIDVARPGQYIEVTGIYMNRYECGLNIKQGFPLFITLIQANLITKMLLSDNIQLNSSLEEEIHKISRLNDLDQRIYNSIAPSIYGHHQVKRALTLAMFGGVQKFVEGTHRIRGDINVLLLGDPGIAKSQFLKSLQKIFYRCIYTTGKGASAVGLTASVKRDHATNQWKLQAGALVLADKGLCLIDQFDKMNEHDRTSIHEAMQQQSISISKAGIVTTLRARCSVIAAANPLQGRYNSQISFSENVDLSQPILSRFDILNVIRDDANQEIDYNLSTFVINSHMKNHPYMSQYQMKEVSSLPQEEKIQSSIDQNLLREYIRYARQKCRPELSQKYRGMIQQFYIKLRQQSKMSGGMNIAVRHIESIIRMAVAHAKIFLRVEVSKTDIQVAISIMLQSFIQTQKHSVGRQIRKKFASYLL